ncbi:MAG: YwiC-like family protein [Polyangiaceae bacterium]|nr:YwiC-like family protein [Polyangiaceae bacterium]
MRPTVDRDPRSLAPREHGAYGQLFVPLATALAMGKPNLASVGFAVSAVSLFFAHEPALVVWGRRGERARRECGARARRRLAILGALAVGSGLIAAMSAPVGALIAAIALLPTALLVGWLGALGREKTAFGEVLAAGALAGVGVPIALSEGVSTPWALGAWGAWTLAFVVSTLVVRAVIAHAKSPVPWTKRTAAPALSAAFVAGVMGTQLLPWACALAAAPMILVASWFAIAPPSPRSLKRVGWTLATSSLLVGVALVAGVHLSMSTQPDSSRGETSSQAETSCHDLCVE